MDSLNPERCKFYLVKAFVSQFYKHLFVLRFYCQAKLSSEVLFKPDKKSRETVQTGYYIFIKGGA